MSGDSEKVKVTCWNCGKVVKEYDAYSYDFYEITGEVIKMQMPYARKYCTECFKRMIEQDEQDKEEYIRLKKKEMFKRACRILERQGFKMYEHQEAIKAVQEVVTEKPDKFDSSYEIIAGIILVHNRIYCKMQYKIGRYQVDFLLPEIGVVLEIDGERHKHHKVYDNNRDLYIKKQLGYGWDIIRIKTEYLDKNASKLVEAINAVVDYRETNHIPWKELSL